ncbi:Fic family protein [Cellulomonas fimi]|uniref:Filamentation induced by cAMP protein Fic n=1 Tax=Cellulomonas fimi (strain ATCC 484 / DSM 20113 / JCM 1341 / CCUG 24087 / LMG 16345 / NBRC 15513 / NCIMB 8980 / NCTC 7547 / NRS-133) TaxID=590998 RepID=F4GZT2_CELFA|nr:Fic family protein [Cellulomonas fimi]AEE47248.1 filamentation induced by cAMP protein Fic [Cellulomonas fimi ATCC 484]NNH06963.1 Fic family protein [Cellulomonas fimi]VEH35714.1 Protein involved in cell division [Cellulomonas fimi]
MRDVDEAQRLAHSVEDVWPALGSEPRSWTSNLDDGRLSVFERQRIARPYRAAVLPKIAHRTLRIGSRVQALVDEATSDIARFDSEVAALPVPMPAVLLRTESASSSQIEHLTTNARNLAMASLGVGSRQNAELVAANVRAMTEALAVGDLITPTTILSVHRALLGDSDPDVAGRWRSEQVWVGASAISPHGADFVPPHHERVESAIDDMVAFAARDDVAALVLAALVHAQFETIHPFVDGNGRTGRVLIQQVLRRRGLSRHTTVPVSAGLLRDPERYFRALTTYRAGEPEDIVEQVAHAAIAAVVNGRRLADDVVAIRAEWRDRITARSDSAAWRLADALFAQPVVNAYYVAATLGVSDRGGRNALEVLAAAGIVEPTTSAKRHRVWQAPQVLTAMDSFAARAGRRT